MKNSNIPENLERIDRGVQGQFEQTTVPLSADIAKADPVLQQIIDDDRLLKNVGDSRTMIQKGSIVSPDGETKIECDITFIRTRNKTGGVDVKGIIPAFVLSGQQTD